MAPPKSSTMLESNSNEIEQRFTRLLAIMKERYLTNGYELDDVHLASILGVHDGVLRKGKSTSVSPALAKAVGNIWQVDLNWLMLGQGEEPQVYGKPHGIEQLSLEVRIARGRWDERKIRHMLSERKLSQKEVAKLLGTDPQRAGNLVRGTLRDPKLRKKLAEVINLQPTALFLCTSAPGEDKHNTTALYSPKSNEDEQLYSLSAIRGILSSIASEKKLGQLLSSYAPQAEEQTAFESAEIQLSVPAPPADLGLGERKRYELNRQVLEKWGKSSRAFLISQQIAERYCREVVGFYDGGRLDDVGGILRDYLQEDMEISDTKPPDADQRPLSLKKGRLIVGNREIEVNDPELLARLPEYLGSKVGRNRLLEWLKNNVK